MPKSLNELISPEQYFKQLTDTFVSLREKIEDEESEHFKMEHFADYTIMQIKKDNINELKRCFDFQEERISICPALENAMVVSYCEALLLGGVGSIMHNFLPLMKPKLLKMYKDYETYYKELCDRNSK